MTITYSYGKNLYVNTTNRCDMHCDFCLRQSGDGVGEADSLWLEREPTREEIWEDLQKRDLNAFSELVFCGYGEPTYRLHDILWVCDRVREISSIPIRMDTNGHGNLIWGEDVAPLFRGRFDTVSISLNAVTPREYVALCHPVQGEAAYQAMLDFARECKQYVPHVILTIVDKDKSPEEIQTCRDIAQKLGVTLRIRSFIDS